MMRLCAQFKPNREELTLYAKGILREIGKCISTSCCCCFSSGSGSGGQRRKTVDQQVIEPTQRDVEDFYYDRNIFVDVEQPTTPIQLLNTSTHTRTETAKSSSAKMATKSFPSRKAFRQYARRKQRQWLKVQQKERSKTSLR